MQPIMTHLAIWALPKKRPESTPASSVLFLNRHHLIICLGLGPIQFVYGSHSTALHLLSAAVLKDLFPPILGFFIFFRVQPGSSLSQFDVGPKSGVFGCLAHARLAISTFQVFHFFNLGWIVDFRQQKKSSWAQLDFRENKFELSRLTSNTATKNRVEQAQLDFGWKKRVKLAWWWGWTWIYGGRSVFLGVFPLFSTQNNTSLTDTFEALIQTSLWTAAQNGWWAVALEPLHLQRTRLELVVMR